MIVLGADMHKRSHTIAAVAALTGELVGDRTVEGALRAERYVARAVSQPRFAQTSSVAAALFIV
jgi:hypothetical protein